MRRAAFFTVVLALAVTALAYAQAKPDYSGTWTLDASRSEMGGPGGGGGRGGPGGPMTVKQTGTELVRETTRGDQTMATTYKLDGTETTNQMGPMTSKSTARWEGDKLVIKTARETPNGTMETTETWSLGAAGKELTIVSSSPRGERKAVYTKQ
ncbi:MAG TPA: hypothetical protein VK911_01570 [Vicinamibacterales bacterium]|nr:hypothetical protein [Vicinamibacterales bacterium]